MRKWHVVKIYEPEKYKPFAKHYGILVDSLQETAVINWNGNGGGICTNVKHEDYGIMSPDYWDIASDGEILITPYGGYIETGLYISK